MIGELSSGSSRKQISVRLELLLLMGITLLAAALRFFRLGQWGFWIDEVFVLTSQEDGFTFNLLRQSLAGDLIRLATSLLGTSEWSARLAPAVIGVLTIPILYLPIRKLWGPRVALIASTLICLSTWHLYWSQNARFYILLLLFYTLGLLAFHIALEYDRPWVMVLALAFFGLAARERLLALFFVPVTVTYLAGLWLLRFEKPPGWRLFNLAIFYGPGLVAGFLFARPYLADLSGWFAGFQRVNNDPVWLAAGTLYYVGLPVVCLAAAGTVFKLKDKDRSVLLLFLAAVLPLGLLMILSIFQYTANRYIFVTLTSWILLASLALNELIEHTHGRVRILTGGVVVLLFVSAATENFLYFQYQNGNRDDWKSAFAYIEANRQPGDLVITTNREIGDYYLGTQTFTYDLKDLAELAAGENRLWLVEDLTTGELFPEALAWIHEHARQLAVYDVHFSVRNFIMRVYLYDPTK
jgi:mannosyltransferase